MTLNKTILVLDLYDGAGNAISKGTAQLVPSAQLTDTADSMLIVQAPVPASFQVTGFPEIELICTDNGAPLPAGWAWTATFTGVPGSPPPITFFLLFAGNDGAGKQQLSSLTPLSVAPELAGSMPLPSGTPGSRSVPMATGTGERSAWQVFPLVTVSSAAPAGPQLNDIWIEVL